MAKKRGHSVDEIYRVLAQRIIDGIYLPGSRLSQSELAEDLDVSRTPLREALNRLQMNGLATATTLRGMEVSAVSHEETEQWYAIRLLVEPPIVASIVGELSADDLKIMSATLKKMQRVSERTHDFQNEHHHFHEVALARYPSVIRDMIESIYLQITRHQRVYFSRPRTPDDFCNLDRYLLDAMIAKDGASAKHILEFHLIDAALGLVMDANPDYVPRALMQAARGIGIEIECNERGVPARPARISWINGKPANVPPLETRNLRSIVSTKTRRQEVTA